jgi:hypothetical protein
MCSQLYGKFRGVAAIMLVLRDDAKREYAYGLPKGYVRFGSLADARARIIDVCFTPKSGHAHRD